MARRLAIVLLASLGVGAPARADPCARGCAIERRACRQEVRSRLRHERLRCRMVLDARTGACASGADCRGYGSRQECLAEATDFGRTVRRARCDRVREGCRACCATEPPGGCAGATLTVNAVDHLGSPGDASLSLSEALELAAGRLDPAGLGAGERAQVRGIPGAGRADRIRFAGALRIAVGRHAAPVDALLPPLSDPGDTIEGEGTVLDGTSMGDVPQASPSGTPAPVLVVTARDTEIAGLVFDRIPAGSIVVTGAPPSGTTSVVVRDNTILGLGRGGRLTGEQTTAITLVAGPGSGNRLAHVRVRHNDVADVFLPVAALGGAASAPGAEASDNLLEDVRIEGNTIARTAEGPSLCTASVSGGGHASDNTVRGYTVERNRVVEAEDVAYVLSSSCVTGGTAARSVIEDATFRRNQALWPVGFGPTRPAGFFLVGAQTVISDQAVSSGDRVSGLTVEENLVDGGGAGLVLAAGYAERCGGTCQATGGLMERVRLRANVWRNLDNGLVLSAASAGEAAALVADQTLRDVELADERLATRGSGLLLQGAFAFGLPLCGPFIDSCTQFPGFHQPGVVRDSRLEGLTVRTIRIEAVDGVSLVGGLNSGSDDGIAGIAVAEVTFSENVVVTSRSGVTIIGGLVQGGGTVQDAHVDAVRLTGNTTGDGGAVGVTVVQELALAPAPPASVGGNGVTNVDVD